MKTLIIALSAVFYAVGKVHAKHMTEGERLQAYHKRNYTWPMEKYQPDTPGWRQLMDERFEQVAHLPTSGLRYEGYYQSVRSAILTPNFTEHGFGLARCPGDLLEVLQQGIRDGFETKRLEKEQVVITGPQPWFIDRRDLTKRVLREMHSYAEAWVGMKLAAHQAYGFRLYRNESNLYMHVDRGQTHVISFILHIGSSEDAEPWPIFIEDFHGRTHEVVLTPGDVLFYESSKCFHGRPRKFNGSWYTSVFVHYYPKNGWSSIDHRQEGHYAIPPVWTRDAAQPTDLPTLEMMGTSMREPDCPDEWCRTQDTVKWSGPGVEGYWIDPTFQKHELNLEAELHTEL